MIRKGVELFYFKNARWSPPSKYNIKCSRRLYHKHMINKEKIIRKGFSYEYINDDENFLFNKYNCVNSLVNYYYVNKKFEEINLLIINKQDDGKYMDDIINILYVLCVKGNISILDRRIKYYVSYILTYVNEYMRELSDHKNKKVSKNQHNDIHNNIHKDITTDECGYIHKDIPTDECGYIHKDITTDECGYIHKNITTDECNKKKNGCVQMYADDNYYNSHNIYNNVNIKVENTIINNKKKFISIKSYLLFLNILKVLDMKNDFNILLKYVSENIHFFSIDIIHRIAFNYDIKNMNNINNNNHEIFFKEILDYIYTLIDYNPSLYFNQMKSINLCINICTNYFFEKRYITEQKKKNDNEDIIYMYNLNYIYINHIITFNNLLHEYNTTKNNIEDYKSEKEYNNNTKKKTLCLFKKSKKIITNVSDILQKGDVSKSIIQSKSQDRKEYINLEDNLNIINEKLKHINDFYFNYYMIDTIYILYNYYTNLLRETKKKKKKKKLIMKQNYEQKEEHFLLYIPDIKNSITNILLHFINIIHINLNTNQQKIKNKKIIQALERILKLSYEFKDKSFNYESFILNYCNMLLVSKLDLSLVDNIKILTIFKHIRKSHREGNQHNVQTQRKQRIDKSLNTCQQKEKKKLNDNKLMYATEHCGKKNEIYDIEDNKYIEQTSLHINQSNISHIRENNLESYDINKHLDNMIKLVCCNLKTCVHNSCGNNICMLIPLIYEFHTYMDCELKNILIVQITCNKHNINENNLINILRVFCKIKYRNDMLDQFFYNQKKFNFYDNYLPSHKQGYKKNLYIFSCPKNFFLFFYYKSKNNLFNYKDMYYIENYVQNNFLEMNIKDFLLLLLIYYKNKVFLLPQLLIKILSIVNNGKKLITEKKKLLFFLYLFSKNYYHLSNDNSEWIDNQNDQNTHLIRKINVFRKSQYIQEHINHFINLINDLFYFIYNENTINYPPEQVRLLLQEKKKNKINKIIIINKKNSENGELAKTMKDETNKDNMSYEIYEQSESNSELNQISNHMDYSIDEYKINFTILKTNLIMMKILYNIYYAYFSSSFEKGKREGKNILNSHHEKLLNHLYICFNENYSKNVEEIKDVAPLLYYFTYFNLYSSFYFEKQMSYIMMNNIIDERLIKYVMLSHVCVKKIIPHEIKSIIKKYVLENFAHFSGSFKILCFRLSHHFLDVPNGVALEGKKNNVGTEKNVDISIFNELLNDLLINLDHMKPNHYLVIYSTISKNMIKNKKYYIELFYHMNKIATSYNNEQLFSILYYMYKTGYSKPKIRKKIRNLILFRHKKRLIHLSMYIKYILPLDEFGIYHLLPIKCQNIIYDKLTVDVKSLIRPPLQHMEINEVKNIKVKNKKKKGETLEESSKGNEQNDAPIYIFEQMVKNY
ncbi:hypothetical protein CYL21_3622 [Plasmodium falciparum NF54]|uniref:Uncharacterized protein n=2 Tax=Plasmodium falciparum TaxID=5833 RepID=A0A143ZYR7_PLAF7|nr:conserved Plasmodium protein, unknown function [Plasmodium falciparum 3D7]KAF4327887.1 hypothetical protein CYL21_3622 [Plasmodium falciparum NF54]PKC43370.1 hypothetical protein CK202_4583 [Plasmodium falciparum NF54]CZT98546.1 conserved Plasmodium protein, unknown function [Plasmodium falciparum 3D7]|eukprot:XP_024329103.1 conserved Plasmodium protein, unknown function [Plasmodium falciparum 3D7]